MMDFKAVELEGVGRNKLEVELIAARKEQVAAKTSWFTANNINVTFVDVEPFALQQVMLAQLTKDNEVVAVVNLKVNSFLFCVFCDKKILYIKEDSINSEQNIAEQINNELQMFFATHSLIVQRIMVGGRRANQAKLLAEINACTHITTEVLNPFGRMKLAKSIDAKRLYQSASSLILSCGLAMR
jgi:Tfp pilus assembly PilM family ATPase